MPTRSFAVRKPSSRSRKAIMRTPQVCRDLRDLVTASKSNVLARQRFSFRQCE